MMDFILTRMNFMPKNRLGAAPDWNVPGVDRARGI